MAEQMIIGAIVPWFGSKRTLAPKIVQHLGPHRCYWEPFAGSMSVLLAKPKVQSETVNDLHGDLVNLARTIKHPTEGPRLYRQLRRTMFAQELWAEAHEALSEAFEPTPTRAYWFFVHSWFGRNGVVGSRAGVNFCVRYTSGGGAPAKRWDSAVRSIPSWRRRMEGLTILSDDGIGICERIEDVDGTVIYADPPYLSKSEQYVHDFEDADHTRLAEALCRFKRTRVVVSYYDHPKLEELYPGFVKIDCAITKGMASMGMRGEKGVTKAPEVLLVNKAADAKGLFNA